MPHLVEKMAVRQKVCHIHVLAPVAAGVPVSTAHVKLPC